MKVVKTESLEFDGKTVAVTGSSGFVGRPLVKKLREKACQVIELDLANRVDVSDWNQVKSTPKMDCLIHLAGKTFVPDSYVNPGDFFRTNLLCTINALELCRLYRAKMVFASSYVYGTPKYLPIDEKHPVAGFNPYASTKLLSEQLCTDYHRHFGIRVLILRPFNIYGPGQDRRFLIPTIVEQAKSGHISLKDPWPKRDFLYIDDAVQAYIKSVNHDETNFNLINIGYGNSFTVAEVADLVHQMIDGHVELSFSGESRKNEVMDTVASITKAKRILDWEPKHSLREGIARTIACS